MPNSMCGSNDAVFIRVIAAVAVDLAQRNKGYQRTHYSQPGTQRPGVLLIEHEAGAKTANLARKHGISEATLYNWKAKYGGMDVPDAKRLRSLEEENRKLKKLLAESMLDQAALKELLTKKW